MGETGMEGTTMATDAVGTVIDVDITPTTDMVVEVVVVVEGMMITGRGRKEGGMAMGTTGSENNEEESPPLPLPTPHSTQRAKVFLWPSWDWGLWSWQDSTKSQSSWRSSTTSPRSL